MRRLVRAMEQTVDDVIGVCRDEGIDADIVKDGVLHVARTEPQLARLEAMLAEHAAWGFGEGHEQRLSRAEVHERVRVEGALAAVHSPHAARVQPARLVRGLLDAVRRRGVTVYEGTEVTAIEPGRAVTPHGTLRADVVLRCLEGYTAGLPDHRRDWLPMNSSMVVTEPLPDSAWDEIGWQGAELVGDGANAYSYAQRTADGRIAIGGRGIPYRFGSRTDTDGVTQRWTIESLTAVLHSQFPATYGVPLAHAWCGVLGVPRDWCASVTLDRRTGLGWAGGYVGSGLSTTYLAARTLADLVLRPGHRRGAPALDEPARAPVGTGAAAVAGRPLDVPAVPGGRPPRGQRAAPAQPAHRSREPTHRPLSAARTTTRAGSGSAVSRATRSARRSRTAAWLT